MAPKPSKSRSTSSFTAANVVEQRINRKGVHAKRGTSRSKTSKNYQKPYRGQGRGR